MDNRIVLSYMGGLWGARGGELIPKGGKQVPAATGWRTVVLKEVLGEILDECRRGSAVRARLVQCARGEPSWGVVRPCPASSPGTSRLCFWVPGAFRSLPPTQNRDCIWYDVAFLGRRHTQTRVRSGDMYSQARCLGASTAPVSRSGNPRLSRST